MSSAEWRIFRRSHRRWRVMSGRTPNPCPALKRFSKIVSAGQTMALAIVLWVTSSPKVQTLGTQVQRRNRYCLSWGRCANLARGCLAGIR